MEREVEFQFERAVKRCCRLIADLSSDLGYAVICGRKYLRAALKPSTCELATVQPGLNVRLLPISAISPTHDILNQDGKTCLITCERYTRVTSTRFPK